MKPTFALDLTRDTIALLHRTPKGWLPIGEAAFDAPDLPEALDYLRKTALGLSPMGMACKVILPNSQILYTDVHAPGPSREDKRRQIAAALEGRTPYAVEDLVFDWSGKGQTVKVAVVARETLEEAEGFATSHRLNPVSFVAIPEAGTFVGEPWFGPTAAAEAILAPGESVDRDREPVTILQRDLAPPVPEAAPEPLPEAPAEPVASTVASDEDDPLPGLEEALNADLPLSEAPDVPVLAPEPTARPTTEATDAEPPKPEVAPDLVVNAEAQPDAPPLPAVEPAAAVPDAVPDVPDVEEAPFAHVTDPTAFPETEEPSPSPKAGTKSTAGAPRLAAAVDDDIPAAPPSAAMVAFASRRAAGPAPARAVDGVTRADSGAAADIAPAGRPPAPAVRPSSPRAFPGLVTAPTIPGTRARPKGKPGLAEAPGATASATGAVKSPARPGGTFGTTAPPRNRSGVVFMVLVGLLLLFLAIIAAWSSYFLSQNGAAGTESAAAVVPTVEVVPGVDDEMLADLQDPAGLTNPLPEAGGPALAGGDAGALATEGTESVADAAPAADETAITDLAAVSAGLPEAAADAPATVATEDEAAANTATEVLPETAPEPVSEPVAEAAPEPVTEPAPQTTVATDVSAAQPPVEDQDEIFLSAMDAPPPALDALALPAPAPVSDAIPEPVMPPPAFGTVYRFDAAGLLVPTPEGILSPDGVMLIAGPPPVLPPSRSTVAAEAAAAAAEAAAAAAPQPGAVTPATPEAAPADGALPPASGASLVTAETEDGAEAAPADPTLSGFRPRARPEGLTPAPDDDAALAPEADSDFAGLRPLPRPEIILAAAASARPADLGAQGASLAAQAEADRAAAAALEAENPSIVAISRRPEARPRDLSRAVEAAVAAAVRTPEPEPQPKEEVVAAAAPAPDLKPEEADELDEPEPARAAPSIPTKASVAKQATFANAINLSKMNLIGTYGTDSRRTALIRQSNGRYKKVKVGDKIDGGTVKAITETEVRYQKGGKLMTLKMPKA